MTLNESSSNLLVCYKRHKNRVLKSFDVFIKFLAIIDLNTLDIRTVEMYPVVMPNFFWGLLTPLLEVKSMAIEALRLDYV